MKIGTDAVLLGAWSPIRQATRILDIGTGCGIIALMLAQRSTEFGSQISAIEIAADAATQAVENFAGSPWPNRLPQSAGEVHLSLDQFSSDGGTHAEFDLAVCNPPFFTQASLSRDHHRKVARHDDALSREALFQQSRKLLGIDGRLCLVLPFDQFDATIELALSVGLHHWSSVNVRPTPAADPKRVLLEFGSKKKPGSPKQTELAIETSRHQYTEDYAALTKDFHLRYAAE